MQTISFKVSDELLAKLERAAKARRVTKSVLVRESLKPRCVRARAVGEFPASIWLRILLVC